MKAKIKLSATIVLYNQDKKELKKAINSFLNIKLIKHLFIVDNSSFPNIDVSEFQTNEISYISTRKNLGFSKANNHTINRIKGFSDYHLVLNPDVFFEENIVEELIKRLREEEDVSLITPKVVFPNGDNQYNIRKYPSAFDLIIRKLHVFKGRIHKQEYRDRDLSKPLYPEAIHGCFMLFKTEDFVSLGGFDERYFLYMEDIDICRKIDAIGKKKLYYPNVAVTHVLKQGSSKSFKLLLYHLSSAIKYFLKWRRYN
ncbi:glycosyltransferase [Tenacibaculum sp. M341]|uniref:glycosyltransferase n=1 Tax=Tenacibaculum sp. M341 TaxID=2530339 RepID=UPI001043D5CC|nr:glycosyltransferase [Tenacibaculum sp. M341]TCI84781.1 glycosyltransferase [Tenacibaculum sp. M341]